MEATQGREWVDKENAMDWLYGKKQNSLCKPDWQVCSVLRFPFIRWLRKKKEIAWKNKRVKKDGIKEKRVM